MNKNIKYCPRCGHDEYYEEYRVKGGARMRHRFDGKQADNSELHEGLQYTLSKKYAYCVACEKRLFKLEEN